MRRPRYMERRRSYNSKEQWRHADLSFCGLQPLRMVLARLITGIWSLPYLTIRSKGESGEMHRHMFYFDTRRFDAAVGERDRFLSRFAKRIGKSRSFVHNIRRGALPIEEDQRLVADALGLRPADLWVPVDESAVRS